MAKINSPITVTLTCGHDVKVTHRRSKQKERPRQHICPQCGKRYLVNVADPSRPIVNEV